MTLLQKLSLAATIGSATFAVAASVPKTILPDNVILCEPNAGCVNQTFYGRNYKVLTTRRFTVMVAISKEGAYTRADVSVYNKTDTPLNLTPDDFRVEVVSPKPKILNYVPPANLILPVPPLPPAPPAAAIETPNHTGNAFVSQSTPSADTAAPAPPKSKQPPPKRTFRKKKSIKQPQNTLCRPARSLPIKRPQVGSTSSATSTPTSSMSSCLSPASSSNFPTR